MAQAKRIERMTGAQERRLQATYQDWLAAGRAGTAADRQTMERAVASMYEEIGEPRPMMLWLDSPLAGVVGSRMVSDFLGQLGDQLRDQLWDQLRDQLWGQLRGQLGDQLRGQLRDQLWDQLRGQLRDQLWDQLWDQLGDQLGDQLRDQLGDQLWLAWWAQHEAAWIAFYSFPEQHLGVSYDEVSSRRLALWADTARSGGWWWPMRGVVVLTERPRYVKVDDEGRLHGDSGPAVIYPDGWGIWAQHGVRVPQQVIEKPETLTAEQILGEENAEVRRVMIERFGAERLMSESQAEILDEVHEPPFPGLLDAKLYRLDVPNDEAILMVKCRNSSPEPDGTFKDYWLRVDPQCATAHEALAWTWGLDVSEYRPVVET